MATYYSGASNGYRLRLDLTPGAQDINNNTTVVAWELLLENSSINSMNHYSTYSLTIDGTVRASASGIEHSVDIDAHKTVSLRSGSITVTHQPDGTRTLPFSAKFRVNEIKYYTPQEELTLSGNLALTTIPRATTPTASTMTMGESSRINLMRASSDFVHDVSYKFGAATGTIATGAGTYVNWTPPLTLATQVPSATQGTLTLTVTTKRGAAVIGTKTLAVRLTVPESVVPDVTYVEMTNYDPAIQTAFAGLVRHQSRAVVKVIANGIRGSTITKVDIKVGGKTYPAQRDGDWWVATTDVLTMSAGTHARGVEVTITDTRGRRATRYEPLTVLNWFPIVATRFDGFRSTPLGDQSDDGRSAFFGSYTQAASVGKKNKGSWHLEVQDPLTKEWSTLRYGDPVTIESDTADHSYFLIDDYDFDPDYSYNVRYTLEDFFQSVTQYVTLPTSSNVVDFKANKKGMAIGKASEQDALEVAWPAVFLDDITYRGETLLEPVEAVLTAEKFSTGYLKLYRIGRLCVTTGFIQFTQEIPPGGDHTIGRVPEGFRPPVAVQTWPVSRSTRDFVALMILANGTIAVYNYSPNPISGTSALDASLTWITND